MESTSTAPSTHIGPLSTIPPNASPGLLFLKALLPAIDALTPDLTPLENILGHNAAFTVNNGPPMPAETMYLMLRRRTTALARFGHVLHRAWDVGNADGTRTLLYETTSTTVFQGDDVEAKVKEFSVVTLVPVDTSGDETGGSAGFRAVDLCSYLDSSPVSERAKVFMASKAKTEASAPAS